MIHRRTRFILLTFCILLSGACSRAQWPVAQATVQPQPGAKSALGFVEHQGRRYDLRNLMDPAYRAASDDLFVRNFSPETALADRTKSGQSSFGVESRIRYSTLDDFSR